MRAASACASGDPTRDTWRAAIADLTGHAAELAASATVSPFGLGAPRTTGRQPGGDRPAGVGQGEGATTLALLGEDEALVLELLEGGVDGSGTRLPAAAGPGRRAPG